MSRARFRVAWTRVARRDLLSIAEYLVARNPEAAVRALGALQRRAATLSVMPERGRVVPELGRLHIREYRELQSPPYRLIYRVAGRRVVVLALLDGRRNLEDILLERLLST